MFRFFVPALACALLAACVPSTTVLEPQRGLLSGQQARIYLLRPNAWAGRLITFQVLIDDKPVGNVASGSYLSVVRPAGPHKITIKPPFDFNAEHEFQASPGRSHYFVVNTKSATMPIMGGGFFTIPGTATGRYVKQQSFLSGIFLAVLDESEGRAALSKLKAP